jgi:HAD superfamily hydrolase (TIGR01490 family)
VADSSSAVAAFDLDGTLTDGGSVFKWLRHIAGNRLVYSAASRRVYGLAWAALRSGETADRVKESLFYATLAGRSLDDVREASTQFGRQHLAAHIRPDTKARLEWHLEQGHRVVIVSASPELYVDAISVTLGAHGAIGTRLASDPLGRLTGGYLGRNCRGEEKIRRLLEWVGTDEVEIYAYGNSRGDRRLLAAADHPFDAGRLGKVGALRRYPRLKTIATS